MGQGELEAGSGQLTFADLVTWMMEKFPETNPSDPGYSCQGFLLPNRWYISFSFASNSYTDVKSWTEHRRATMLELAIFDTEQNWYLAEGMMVMDGSRNGVFPFMPVKEAMRVIEYVAAF